MIPGPTPPGVARRSIVAPVAAVVVALLAGCTPPNGAATPSPGRAPGEPATPPEETVATAVYFATDTRAGFRLARESHDVDAADPLTAALEQMIAGPRDPDYATGWNPDTEVLAVSRQGGTIAVNLSADARTANVGSEGAALMVQQLVYTVTEAAEEDVPVRLLVDGEPAGELWGAVVWDTPVVRADPLDVRVLVQIDEPRDGAAVGSPLTVSGDAAAFEATVPWRVVDRSGFQVAAGSATTAQGQVFAPYELAVELGPGTYTVEVSEGFLPHGAAGTPMTDTKTVTID